MLLNLRPLEKKAIVKVLLDIIHADDKVTVGERDYFQKLQNVLGISNAEIEEAMYLSVTGCLSILNDLQATEKEALVVMMLGMIIADGEAHEEEIKIFSVVCKAASLPLPDDL